MRHIYRGTLSRSVTVVQMDDDTIAVMGTDAQGRWTRRYPKHNEAGAVAEAQTFLNGGLRPHGHTPMTVVERAQYEQEDRL